MTIKRQWMRVLILSVALSVAVNSIFLSLLINRYFIDYSKENYNYHISQLEELSKKVLLEKDYNKKQINMQLESHLSDPINEIKLFDSEGNLLADVVSDNHQTMGMMRSRVINHMMGTASGEIDSIDIIQNGNVIGKLNITRYSSIGNSLGTRRFVVSLIFNSLMSFGFVFILIFIIGRVISNKMSKDLMLTAEQALDIDLGNISHITQSNVKEIRTIQQSLETLQTRLKLKQTSRKKLIEELVHQTRTPLTILRTHLEGFQDGIIQLTPDEIKTCEVQIDNITSIITNMSGMIDAERDIDSIKIEQVELNTLLKQIVGGLKIQFEKKGIVLELLNNEKLTLETDHYKLSQIIYNLLTNAYKFTASKGKVTVEYKKIGDNIEIAIEDSGIGISAEEQSKIFDAYYRGKNSLNAAGDGIGLYIVKENMMKIHGEIKVQSELGKGSKFIIIIPLKYGEGPQKS
ncbi:MAG: sensor histidine kinase [Solirubrobacterales bacterium]